MKGKRWVALHLDNRQSNHIHEPRYFWTRWGAERYRKSIYECHPLLPKTPVSFVIKLVRNS